jgi:DNA-binding response OmpR family regulator
MNLMDSQKKILLIEDEQLIRELYARQLSKANFYVKAVGSAEEGLAELKKETFNLLLLDIMLPGMNGLQMLRQYKLENPTSQLIVILLTNLGQESVIKEGFELGAQAYIIKSSYTPDQVVQEVKNSLESKQNPATPPTV